jgi:protein-tyrosine phosphatase
MIHLLSPENGAVLSMKTAIQKEFEAHCEEYAQNCGQWRAHPEIGDRDHTAPAPLVFSWEGGSEHDVFLLTEAESGKAVFRQVGGSSASVYNLLLGKTYAWRVGDSESRTFTVDDTAPRWLLVGGTGNVRDLGGWKTLDGKMVRQGLVYRGCSIDIEHTLTEEGFATLRDTLGIKTELDLRAPNEVPATHTESVLGPDVRYVFLPIDAYYEVQTEYCRDFFNLMADETAYPVYLHCVAGADRTGTFCFLLGALLGVPLEDLYRDYEMTQLSEPPLRSRYNESVRRFLDRLSCYGQNVHEQVEGFALACGVSEETIARIRTLLLD